MQSKSHDLYMLDKHDCIKSTQKKSWINKKIKRNEIARINLLQQAWLSPADWIDWGKKITFFSARGLFDMTDDRDIHVIIYYTWLLL